MTSSGNQNGGGFVRGSTCFLFINELLCVRVKPPIRLRNHARAHALGMRWIIWNVPCRPGCWQPALRFRLQVGISGMNSRGGRQGEIRGCCWMGGHPRTDAAAAEPQQRSSVILPPNGLY